MTKHIPGPWEWDIFSDGPALVGPPLIPGSSIRQKINFSDPEGPNARLIATAPEVLAALENCLSLVKLKFRDTDPTANVAIEEAEAAIAEAKGETS